MFPPFVGSIEVNENYFGGRGKGQTHIIGSRNFWNQAKRHLRKYNGLPQHHFELFLKECGRRVKTQSPQKMLKEPKGSLKEVNT